MTTVLETREGAIAILTLNRPDKLNALNVELLNELDAAVTKLSATSDVSCVILTGSGDKAFAAGADIAGMLQMNPEQARAMSELGHRIGMKMEKAPFPFIAAVNGFALGGGCELALACDFIYASDKAKLGQPEITLGVIPGFGGTNRLARRVGIGRARELCYVGEPLSAEEALRIGLVNAVFPHAELLEKAKATATKIASRGRIAVAQAKRTLYTGADVPIDVGNAFEQQAFALCFATNDRTEGMKAFVEKRKPTFTGT